MEIILQRLQSNDITQATEFAIQTRQLLFPEVYQSVLPYDLTHFQDVYIHHPQGACFVVKDEQKIIGMIAYRAYNHRFALDIPKDSVEVVKLFIQPDYRRRGLASRLCDALFKYATQQKIEHFYLHTHPFLPAAEHFWAKQGFDIIYRQDIQNYDTIHMFKSA